MKEIAERVGVSVGSVSLWVRDIVITGEIEDWWLGRLGLPPVCLRAPTVNRASSATKRRRRVLPYGTACIGVNSTFIVQSIYGAIQEYRGIDRPEWLDL